MKEKPAILIIEDEEFNYDLPQFILTGLNVRIYWAKTADEGMKYFKEKAIDLVLMDVKLPDKNGYQLTREFKSMDSSVPVIAQTSYALAGDREKAIEAGCDDYLAKPIRKAKLLETVKPYLQ